MFVISNNFPIRIFTFSYQLRFKSSPITLISMRNTQNGAPDKRLLQILDQQFPFLSATTLNSSDLIQVLTLVNLVRAKRGSKSLNLFVPYNRALFFQFSSHSLVLRDPLNQEVSPISSPGTKDNHDTSILISLSGQLFYNFFPPILYNTPN